LTRLCPPCVIPTPCRSACSTLPNRSPASERLLPALLLPPHAALGSVASRARRRFVRAPGRRAADDTASACRETDSRCDFSRSLKDFRPVFHAGNRLFRENLSQAIVNLGASR
jgi:hypothetical protein